MGDPVVPDGSPEMPSRFPFYLLGLMVLIAGAAVGIWLAPQGPPLISTTTEAATDQGGNSAPLPIPRSGDDVSAVRDAAESSRELPTTQVTTLMVTFFEYEGARKVGVPGLEVEIQSGVAGDSKAADSLYTDDQGRVVKQVPSDANAHVALKSPSWRFAGRSHETSKLMYVTGKSANAEYLTERVSVYTVSIIYGDGRPYSGLASVLPNGGPPKRILVSEGDPVILTLPSRKNWTLYAPSRRPGFAVAGLEFTEDHVGETSRLVLPRADDSAGVFEVVCADFPEDALVDIRISRKGDWVSATTLDEVKDWPARLPYTSKTLSPGTYDVKVQTSRHSKKDGSRIGVEVAELQSGQTQTVRVKLAPPGSIRVVIVGEDKMPISRARLAYANSTYFNWGWARKKPLGYQNVGSDAYALSDSDGVAVLSGLPPGPVEVLCDAEGYGQIVLQANVLPGRECDLGTVNLAKAAGSIRIEILHREAAENDEYEVMLLKPEAGIIRSAERFSGKSHQITGLNLLTYVVSIRYVAGGYGAFSQQVTLTEESPQDTITFKMQKPPLKRDDE